MGFLNIFRKRTEDWYSGMISFGNTPGDIGSRNLVAGEEYLSVFMKSMRIVNVRQGLSKFYSVIHSFASVPHRSGGPAEFNVVVSPAKLGELDAKHIDRIIDINKRLLGPVPYRGGDFALEMGLFSIKSADLAKPFMALLDEMSSLAGVSVFNTALPYAKPLQNGINLLTGGIDETILEIGLSRVFKPVKTGYYVVIRAPKNSVDVNDLHVDNNDFRLLTKDGQPLKDYPYIVFTIDGNTQRDDWFEIPALAAAYKKVKNDIAEGHDADAKVSIEIFNRVALACDDLLQKDAAAIIEEVKKETDAILAPVLKATLARGEMKELRELEIYRESSIVNRES